MQYADDTKPTHMDRQPFLERVGCIGLAAAILLSGATLAQPQQVQDLKGELPPVRTVTQGPKFHWRGYYDKQLFDPSDRYLLSNEVDFEGRSPRADDVIRVGMVDLQDNDRWIELGSSRAWNWQQGCMLQWLPGRESTVVWNDRQEGRFVCHVLDVETRKRRTLPGPIYALSPCGRWAISTDFRRLNDVRRGYGYAGLPDPNAGVLLPKDIGIWKMDMQTGKRTLLFSLADGAAVPFTGREDRAPKEDAKHWFNHLLVNTDGSRILFLHRWKAPSNRTFLTRMFTADPDGGTPYVLDPYGDTSHFIWRDPSHVMAWAWHPSHGNRFYLYRDKTDAAEVVGKDAMPRNGHNTYIPGTNNEWVLNDTYPDKERNQNPYLYHIPTHRCVALGHFLLPKEYRGEWRCDLHPCASRNGKLISIDSPHGGNGRQVHVIDVSAIVGR